MALRSAFGRPVAGWCSWVACLIWLGSAASTLAASAADGPGPVQLGIDVLATNAFRSLAGKRIGLLTNPSGVNGRLESTLEVLQRSGKVQLTALFAAEHGLTGEVPAGTEFPDVVDSKNGLPIYSLYGPGPVRKPTAKMLRGIDVLVYDIQDTGCRSYTFISSMGLAMEACGENNIEFVVLDRPNPVGGTRVEGPTLDLQYRSMIGQWRIPYLYGMTSGELARMIAGERWIRLAPKLTVIPMKGWRRHMAWRDTGLAWVPTSPNIPHADSPLHYASTGVLGNFAGISIGLGANLPFQCVAAPWLDGHALSRALNGLVLPGVRFRPATLKPMQGAFAGKAISGVQVHFTNPARAPLLAINFHAHEAIRRLSGRDLYGEAVREGKDLSILDKIMGTSGLRTALATGQPASAIISSWLRSEDAFRKQRQAYLLYQ